eukprot:2619544-Amphidinium_carterae.1
MAPTSLQAWTKVRHSMQCLHPAAIYSSLSLDRPLTAKAEDSNHAASNHFLSYYLNAAQCPSAIQPGKNEPATFAGHVVRG